MGGLVRPCGLKGQASCPWHPQTRLWRPRGRSFAIAMPPDPFIQVNSRRLCFSISVLWTLAVLCSSMTCGLPVARSEDPHAAEPRAAETVVRRWRVGVTVRAGSGACRGIVATTSVPTDWPEQEVRIVDEETSPRVRLTYKMVDGAVREMTARIASLAAGQQATAIVTFEVKRSWQRAPENTALCVAPDPKRLDRKIRPFLAPSPYIESTNPQIKALADSVGVGRASAWDRVEAIYDWVRDQIRFEDNRGQQVKTTLETLRDGTGDCDELTSLFIAICRAGGIPARTVRVPGHCYPEFYLEDEQGKGHWFPCQAAGARAFGEMREERPILQKGDRLLLRDPYTKRMQAYRFLPDTLVIAHHRTGASPPQLKLVCELAAD
jgi:hypothetical protein